MKSFHFGTHLDFVIVLGTPLGLVISHHIPPWTSCFLQVWNLQSSVKFHPQCVWSGYVFSDLSLTNRSWGRLGMDVLDLGIWTWACWSLVLCFVGSKFADPPVVTSDVISRLQNSCVCMSISCPNCKTPMQKNIGSNLGAFWLFYNNCPDMMAPPNMSIPGAEGGSHFLPCSSHDNDIYIAAMMSHLLVSSHFAHKETSLFFRWALARFSRVWYLSELFGGMMMITGERCVNCYFSLLLHSM